MRHNLCVKFNGQTGLVLYDFPKYQSRLTIKLARHAGAGGFSASSQEHGRG
jgi:hypothetical protein